MLPVIGRANLCVSRREASLFDNLWRTLRNLKEAIANQSIGQTPRQMIYEIFHVLFRDNGIQQWQRPQNCMEKLV